MSKELEPAPIEGTIVEGPIPLHMWATDLVSDGRMASAHFLVTGDRVYTNSPGFTPGDFHENA